MHNKTRGTRKERCKSCLLKLQNIRNRTKKNNPLHGKMKCDKCMEYKNSYDFFKQPTDKKQVWNICKDCHNKDKSILDKQCNKCLIIKVISDFTTDPTKSDGHHTVCRLCQNANAIITRAKNTTNICGTCKKNFTRKSGLKAHINRGCLSAEQKKIQEEQNKVCDGCGKKLTSKNAVRLHKKSGACKPKNKNTDNEEVDNDTTEDEDTTTDEDTTDEDTTDDNTDDNETDGGEILT
jgi:hypothetical protein